MTEYVFKKFEAKNSLIVIQGPAFSDVFNQEVGEALVSNFGFFCQDGQVTCFVQEDSYQRAREYIFLQLKKDQKWGKNLVSRVSKGLDEFVDYSLKLLRQKNDFTVQEARDYIQLAAKTTALAYFTDWYSYKANEWIKNFVELNHEDFLVLTSPKQRSYVMNYEIALAQSKIGGSPTPVEIENRFFWVRDNYMHIHQLTKEKIQDEIAAMSDDEAQKLTGLDTSIDRKRIDVANRLQLDPYVFAVVDLLSDFVDLQDKRKEACMITNNVVIEMYRQILDKKGITSDSDKNLVIDNAFPYWITDFDREKLLSLSLEARTGVLFEMSRKDIFGDVAKARFDEIVGKIDNRLIKGFPANRGRIQGIVKIVNRTDDFAKVVDGDILVSSMTRPDMMPILKKAAAFVTDEGGITCHAAIVSREMKKPCIIGTKIATKVLKDGDFVEVDAEMGIVRKLADHKQS